MNDPKVEIKEIVLNIGKKEIKLTPDECKKLKTLLDEIYGKEIIKEIIKEEHHHWNHNYLTWYYYPSLTCPTVSPVYCTTSTGGYINCSGTTITLSLDDPNEPKKS